MSPGAVRGLGGVGGRRARLRRERTAAQLRRHAQLEAEAQEQLGPTLGPAGRPMGDAAMALWRRRQADAYLAMPPWWRARRTWVSWGRGQRLLAVLGLAAAWTVVCLPLRMLGLASLEASQVGVAVLAAAAPLAALAPPRPRGRFAGSLPEEAGAPWRGSRRARAAGRLLMAAGVVALAALAVMAIVGPGSPQAPPAGRETPAARHAGVSAAQAAVDAACGAPVAGAARPLGRGRYAVEVRGGGEATVALLPVGFDRPGPRARVEGTAPCPG